MSLNFFGYIKACGRPNLLCKGKDLNGILKCVRNDYICDDEWDCEDGDDEKNCVHLNTCFGDRFKCEDGKQCVNSTLTCDWIEDCKDGSDESPELCGRQILTIITLIRLNII
jgi:hypothetical protein